ncbi:MAG TPA: NUDIX hydrolase [Acidimicrobiales bacterium]|jgi:ADP-ribose pyrophosphatase|nr:NUDIX hydrolase [Acidimicrobiales bacterium]
MSPQFRKVGEEPEFQGTLIQVSRVEFEGPDGHIFERDVVHHPGAVVVVPLIADDRVLMVRQFRAAIGDDLFEIPAGKRDVDGEPTEETAQRELAEEVGRRAGRIDLLARFYNSPGFTDEFTWLYLARDLVEVPLDRQGAEEQAMTVEEVALASVPEMIRTGELVDAKTIIGLTLTREFLGIS